MRDSSIEVEVLDLGDFETDHGAIVHPGWAWGRVTTSAGMYVLNTEGEGEAHPITEKRPWVLPLYAHNQLARGVIARLRVLPSILRDWPVKERVQLGLFIRDHGPLLERKYKAWRKRLQDAGAEVAA